MAGNTQQLVAKVVGVVLTLVGLAGFVPALAGTLSVFALNSLHNGFHLVTGLLGVWAGFTGGGKNSVMYNKWLGVVYLLVAVLGFAGLAMVTGLLNINTADNWLHLVLGVVLAGVGFGVHKKLGMK